jgi:hypothetical protein
VASVQIDAGAIVTSWGIANFDDKGDTTLTGGPMGPMPDASITHSYDAVVFHGATGASLKLHYDLSVASVATQGWNGFWLKLSPGGTPTDLSGYTHLVFYVRGGVGGVEPLKIQLANASADAARKTSFLYVNDYLDGGMTSAWREVRIPLRAFANLDSLANVTELDFVFESGYAARSPFVSVGDVYLDDIVFDASASSEPLRVDHFGDADDRNALGGRIGIVGSLTSAGMSFSDTEFKGSARSLKVTYDVTGSTGTDYAGYTFPFGGGADGSLPVLVDVSSHRYLRFWAKAGVEGNPKQFKVAFQSDAPAVNISQTVSGLTTAWQQFSIDMNSFLPAQFSKTSFKRLMFMFERAVILSNPGNLQGSVYFDQIEISD